ncbi:hypothetical protein ACJX0J_039634, partial [Zea mays]
VLVHLHKEIYCFTYCTTGILLFAESITWFGMLISIDKLLKIGLFRNADLLNCLIYKMILGRSSKRRLYSVFQILLLHLMTEEYLFDQRAQQLDAH